MELAAINWENFKEAVKKHPKNCDEDECIYCGYRDCPHQEPLHYHHDGCPACVNEEMERLNTTSEVQKR